MLDGTCAFQDLDGQAFDIWWGAYLGMPEQILAHGRLGDVRDRIIADMREHGFDPYFDPADRYDVDPDKYPVQMDTRTVARPVMAKTIAVKAFITSGCFCWFNSQRSFGM